MAASRSPLAPRGAETWRIYASNALGAYTINGLGAVQLPLRAGLGISYEEAAFFATMYAAATIVVGLVGGRVARALGPDRLLVVAMAAFALGAVTFWMPSHPAALAGAFILGAAGGLTLQLIPTALMRLHGEHTAVAMAEANALATFCGMAAPLVIGGMLALGLGWQFGYLLPLLGVAAVVVLLAVRSSPDAARPAPAPLRTTGRRGAAWAPLASIIMAVSAEFGIVFWAARSVEERFGVPTSVAVATTGVFVAGIATGRLLGRPLIGRLEPFRAIMMATAAALAGYAIFYFAPIYPVALVGLAICGLSMAIMFPILMTRILAAFPGRPERASQFGVLANGVSVGLSPLLLAVIAGAIGMRLAMIWPPALLVVLAIVQLAHHAAGRRSGDPLSTGAR